ncbi:MAG: glycoside hydrolase family 43 protein, partial [Clostridia bacterium]|nr:glycoside hydrolase family 43 protein [Clostridia bacterium]
VLYHTDSLDKDWNTSSFEYVGVLMQSAIPQNGDGTIDVNSIDPQIIYDTDGKMYMAYGSFGTGNWMLELDPQTGLRADGVYADGNYKDWTEIRRERNKVVSGDAETMRGSKYLDDFLAGKEVKSDFYGTMISLGAMEAPVLARHDGVKIADETAQWQNGEPVGVEGKTYYYSMHSYNWLESNYQMWGGRSESVWGTYQAVNGGLVYNVDVGSASNQGNKYMGAFKWRADSKSEDCTEFDIVLPGHNDLYTAQNGASYAAYITRTFDYGAEAFAVQIHQYYLNSMGDICINPNRYGGEIDRGVTAEELLHYTDGGRFEMVVLTNAQDATIQSPGDNAKLLSINNESFEVVLTEDGKITRGGAEIGSWLMYGKGYIKFTFNETLKGSGSYDSGETVYYGVVRPAWLGNRNQSGFTISCLGHSGSTQNMAMFMNNYSTITFE